MRQGWKGRCAMWMEYLERICVFLLIAETMLKLCPSAKYENYVKMVTGLICLAMILLPVTSFLKGDEEGLQIKLETFERELKEAMEKGERQMEEELKWDTDGAWKMEWKMEENSNGEEAGNTLK